MKRGVIMTALFLAALAGNPSADAARLDAGQTAHSLSTADDPTGGTPAKPAGDIDVGEYRASQVIGRIVKNLYGETLGKISDLLLDPEDPGRILFAVVIQGGFLGVGGKLTAVPFSALTWNEREQVYDVNMTKERLAAAPSFYRDHWPDLHHRTWSEEVYRYYGQTPYWTEDR